MKATQTAHQVIRLSDECLRCATHGGHAGSRKALSRPQPSTMPISSSSTPVTSARRLPRRSIRNSADCARLKDEAARQGRRMNIAVAGCVAQAEGNEIIAPRAGGRCRGAGRRAIIICRNCWRAPKKTAARWRRNFQRKTSSHFCRRQSRTSSARAAFRLSSPFRKAATSSARSASCRIRAARRFRVPSPGSSTT